MRITYELIKANKFRRLKNDSTMSQVRNRMVETIGICYKAYDAGILDESELKTIEDAVKLLDYLESNYEILT